MFFDAWYDLARLVLVGTLSYVGLIFILRMSGKRTLSKMNAFDLVVTVAFGSAFASTILSGDVSLSEGIAAFMLLCALQYGVAFASVRSEAIQDCVKAAPVLLFHKGRCLAESMRRERVTEEEIFAAIRASGAARLSSVDAVVLETDGSFSVLSGANGETADALRYVQGAEDILSSPPHRSQSAA
jgi:uncharacterized membrane protein YcaP (DUF421 family)